jgi:hypothetical protein
MTGHRDLISKNIHSFVARQSDIEIKTGADGWEIFTGPKSVRAVFIYQFVNGAGFLEDKEFTISVFVSGNSSLYCAGNVPARVKEFKDLLEIRIKKELTEFKKIIKFSDREIVNLLNEKWKYVFDYLFKRNIILSSNLDKAYSELLRLKRKDSSLYGKMITFFKEIDLMMKSKRVEQVYQSA